MLFGLPHEKDEVGSDAYSESGIVQEALRAIRQNVKDLLLMTDICLCEYTSHGHCGVIKHRDVENDSTLKLLADTAVSHARAGADMVAPSDMMDGRVAAIRARSTAKDSRTLRSWRIPQSMRPPFTVRFGKPRIPRLNLATVAATRWILRMPERR